MLLDLRNSNKSPALIVCRKPANSDILLTSRYRSTGISTALMVSAEYTHHLFQGTLCPNGLPCRKKKQKIKKHNIKKNYIYEQQNLHGSSPTTQIDMNRKYAFQILVLSDNTNKEYKRATNEKTRGYIVCWRCEHIKKEEKFTFWEKINADFCRKKSEFFFHLRSL